MKDVVDRSTGELKGHYAFVWTGGVEQATEAKNALHNLKINGKKLQVKYAREGAFKITSMTITTGTDGATNRKVVTLRSDVGGEEPLAAGAPPTPTRLSPILNTENGAQAPQSEELWEDSYGE